jgi:uncharacterized membrane protein YhaH (DUF805 family)
MYAGLQEKIPELWRQVMNKLLGVYFSFQGRLSRKGFWQYYVIPFVLVGYLLSQIGYEHFVIDTLLVLSIWPSLAVQVKRWHDINKSGWWVLILLVPIIGGLIALIANGFLPGTKGENEYGQPV